MWDAASVVNHQNVSNAKLNSFTLRLIPVENYSSTLDLILNGLLCLEYLNVNHMRTLSEGYRSFLYCLKYHFIEV